MLAILRKDLALGPRSPIFLYALVFPVVATLLVQVVFGDLFAPSPRLGIVDADSSQLTSQARDLANVHVTKIATEGKLKGMVEANDLDMGLVLPDDFDQALRAGRDPGLKAYVSGESLASNRVILDLATIGLIRGIVGAPSPIDVNVQTVGGGEFVPVADRLIPLLVLFPVLIAGLFVPAASIVEEKEKGTLLALLVTPARRNDVLVAKGLIGFVLALAAAIVTLLLNRAFGAEPLTLVVILCVAALMAVELGLTVGALARDTNALFAVMKTGNILLLAPVVFFIWPNLPQWLPRLFPTYYFLNPLYRIAIEGAGPGDVWRQLAVAALICVVLLGLVAATGRRMEARLATA
jgi:ABC-2 type transport system permease protein